MNVQFGAFARFKALSEVDGKDKAIRLGTALNEKTGDPVWAGCFTEDTRVNGFPGDRTYYGFVATGEHLIFMETARDLGIKNLEVIA